MDTYVPDSTYKNKSRRDVNIVSGLSDLILEGDDLTNLYKYNLFNSFLNTDFSQNQLEKLVNYDPTNPNEPVYYVYTVDITSGIEAVKNDMLDGDMPTKNLVTGPNNFVGGEVEVTLSLKRSQGSQSFQIPDWYNVENTYYPIESQDYGVQSVTKNVTKELEELDIHTATKAIMNIFLDEFGNQKITLNNMTKMFFAEDELFPTWWVVPQDPQATNLTGPPIFPPTPNTLDYRFNPANMVQPDTFPFPVPEYALYLTGVGVINPFSVDGPTPLSLFEKPLPAGKQSIYRYRGFPDEKHAERFIYQTVKQPRFPNALEYNQTLNGFPCDGFVINNVPKKLLVGTVAAFGLEPQLIYLTPDLPVWFGDVQILDFQFISKAFSQNCNYFATNFPGAVVDLGIRCPIEHNFQTYKMDVLFELPPWYRFIFGGISPPTNVSTKVIRPILAKIRPSQKKILKKRSTLEQTPINQTQGIREPKVITPLHYMNVRPKDYLEKQAKGLELLKLKAGEIKPPVITPNPGIPKIRVPLARKRIPDDNKERRMNV